MLNIKKKNKYQYTICKEDLEYSIILQKVKSKRELVDNYRKFFFKEIDILYLIDKVDSIILNLDISEEELIMVEKSLKIKLLDEKYSTEDVLFEVNILANNEISNYEKDKRLKRLREKIKGRYYQYKNPKKIVPEDLKKYNERNWVSKIIINPVGTKR